MPIYEYRCENDHTFEVLQPISDPPVEVCEVCDAPVRRVLHPVAVHFKGSGFYTTDYGKRNGSKADSGESSKSESKSPESKSSESKSSDSKASDSKPASGSKSSG
jgi:putative FmdB family regulatory protein